MFLVALAAHDSSRTFEGRNSRGFHFFFSFLSFFFFFQGIHSLFRQACFDGSDDIARMLLEKGSPLDGKDDQGFTPLLAAASQRHFGLVKTLLELGANPSLSTETQSFLLHYLIRTDPPLT